MNILITGNMGYIGPVVVEHLRKQYPQAKLIGLDTGFFASCLCTPGLLPECKLNIQHYADVRNIPEDLLVGVDAVVHLAAISNDPMGNEFEAVTQDINFHASVKLAQNAKKAGVGAFVYASSCSMYGSAEDRARTEDSPLNPLTAYARSKIDTEKELERLADDSFTITSLRFSTACGMSDRLRLDLVLNDFVAGAIADRRITILSDGTPWRPLIDVKDMARAIEWAMGRLPENGGAFLAVNIGSNEWNYQVRELAETVAQVIPGVQVSINKDAQPDKRSYRVDFELFRRLAPDYQPQVDLRTSIQELKEGLEGVSFNDSDFRNSRYIRLKVLRELRETNQCDSRLHFL
jgi:nucleoside-diphosphate-sugar epimerase